mmetsp:Transcript_13747/g.15174  ORF Transcript_13747/g.15174 Transcript_13747/m.15174 type:complete len:104 (-) Transcript_13747:103-414(-)
MQTRSQTRAQEENGCVIHQRENNNPHAHDYCPFSNFSLAEIVPCTVEDIVKGVNYWTAHVKGGKFQMEVKQTTTINAHVGVYYSDRSAPMSPTAVIYCYPPQH